MRKFVDSVRSYLEQEHKRLSDELEVRDDRPTAGSSDASPVSEKGERAAQTFEMEKHFVDLRRIKDRLAEVERALEKIAKGTYGVCDSCGEIIPASRLEILPQTAFCAGCKGKQRGYTVPR